MGTVAKALSLLDFFNRNRSTIGLSDMARLSGLNKATVHRLMQELQAQGFVEQIGAGREYRLGPAFLRLAALREAAVPLRDLAASVLHDLADVTGETTHVSLLYGHTLSTVAYAYSDQHGTLVTMDDAQQLTFHNTSSGLATLAFSDPAFTDAVLAQPLEARTPETITDPAQIRAMLPAIRASGIAESVGGFEADVHSHGVPLFDSSAQVIGAMAVAAPTTRMTRENQARIKRELRAHAIHLTRLLGGFLPEGFNRSEAA